MSSRGGHSCGASSTGLRERVFAGAAGARVPLSVQLDLTARCNEACRHCYRVVDRRRELDTAEIRGLLHELAEAGTLFLTLSGGEPLLRADLVAILARARELHFDVRIKTNGTLVTEALARALAALAVREVAVSVYSPRAAAHDAVTGLAGSLARTLAGICVLRAAGVRVRLVSPLMRVTVSDLPGLRALAARLGTALTVDPLITVRNDGGREPLALRLDREGIRRVLADSGLATGRGSGGQPPRPSDLPCGAGHNACYISPYGDVAPCVQLPVPCGNVREASFASIWQASPTLARLRAMRERDLQPCSGCALRALCRRCPGQALLEDGDLRGPSTAACVEAAVRAELASPGSAARPGRGRPATTFAPAWEAAGG